MNKIKYIWGFLMLAVFSCTDFVDPAIPYSGFETGAYLRTITPPTAFNFFALGPATFTLEVEAVDASGGTTVQDVQILVRRRRGATLSPEVALTTVPGSAFTASGKYTRASISIPLADALAAMSFTTADINGGDFIEYRLILTDTQGRTFTNTNLSADVQGGAFYASPFFYRVAVVCPVDATLYLGQYLYESVIDGPYGATYGNSKNVTLQAVTGAATKRRIVGLVYLEQLAIGNGSQTIDLDLVCGTLVFPSYSANVGCGGSIGLGPAQGANVTTFSPTDDSVLLVGLTDFLTDGGCGESPTQVRFRLTKL